jgi:transposase
MSAGTRGVRDWSAEDIRRVEAMRAEGRSYSEIALAMNRTKNAISGLFHRIDRVEGESLVETQARRRAEKAAANAALDKRIISLKREGRSVKAIAEIVGAGTVKVQARVQALGLSPEGRARKVPAGRKEAAKSNKGEGLLLLVSNPSPAGSWTRGAFVGRPVLALPGSGIERLAAPLPASLVKPSRGLAVAFEIATAAQCRFPLWPDVPIAWVAPSERLVCGAAVAGEAASYCPYHRHVTRAASAPPLAPPARERMAS